MLGTRGRTEEGLGTKTRKAERRRDGVRKGEEERELGIGKEIRDEEK
jgi:hypothetical protein